MLFLTGTSATCPASPERSAAAPLGPRRASHAGAQLTAALDFMADAPATGAAAPVSLKLSITGQLAYSTVRIEIDAQASKALPVGR
jgi:hypothetical protein